MIDIDTLNILSKFDGTSSGDVVEMLHRIDGGTLCLMSCGSKAYLPDYFNDSNAIRLLIECANEKQIIKYAKILAFSLNRYPPHWNGGDIAAILSATPEQHAIAFCEMINQERNEKWKTNT